MGYEKGSQNAILGELGELRLFNLLKEKFGPESKIIIQKGLTNPAGNGKWGDILFRESEVDAPRCSIEVKMSSPKYPGSVCLSRFEHAQSTAEWLAAGNADEMAGWWFCSMDHARGAAELKQSSDGGYYVVKKKNVKTISFAELIETIKGKF